MPTGPETTPPDEVDRVEAREVGGGRSIRWWPLASGVVLLLVVLWALVTGWVGIWGSHPIGWILLASAASAGLVLVVIALLVAPHDGRSAWTTWLARGSLVVGTAIAAVTIVYTRPLSADQVALDALADGNGVQVQDESTIIRMTPDVARSTGLVFYPGARVDPRAYAHVLRPVAEAGYPVVILKQPLNLAVLDGNAADRVVGDTDDGVDRWVIGGHSLGGAFAARYAETARDELVGLLMYAAFPVNDMSDRSGLAVSSVSGTEDGLATAQDIDDSVAELPPTTEFVRIVGAIHSFFGDYGLQKGDGTPTISRQDAQSQIAEASVGFLDGIDAAAADGG